MSRLFSTYLIQVLVPHSPWIRWPQVLRLLLEVGRSTTRVMILRERRSYLWHVHVRYYYINHIMQYNLIWYNITLHYITLHYNDLYYIN